MNARVSAMARVSALDNTWGYQAEASDADQAAQACAASIRALSVLMLIRRGCYDMHAKVSSNGRMSDCKPRTDLCHRTNQLVLCQLKRRLVGLHVGWQLLVDSHLNLLLARVIRRLKVQDVVDASNNLHAWDRWSGCCCCEAEGPVLAVAQLRKHSSPVSWRTRSCQASESPG